MRDGFDVSCLGKIEAELATYTNLYSLDKHLETRRKERFVMEYSNSTSKPRPARLNWISKPAIADGQPLKCKSAD